MQREDPEWVTKAARAMCFLRVAEMDAVSVRRDLTCPTRDGGTLFFDLYGASPERGVVLLIHGGPIPGNLLTPPKEWGVFQSLARVLGASGLATVMFNHRFYAIDQARVATNDVEDMCAHVAANGQALGVDAGRICVWAFSGGGFLLSPFLRETPDAVRCAVAYYAVLHAQTPEFSPAVQLAANTGRVPALLVARAGLDMPQINETIDHFIVQALKKNAGIDVMNHATGQHAFDCRDDNARTCEILSRTVEFIRGELS